MENSSWCEKFFDSNVFKIKGLRLKVVFILVRIYVENLLSLFFVFLFFFFFVFVCFLLLLFFFWFWLFNFSEVAIWFWDMSLLTNLGLSYSLKGSFTWPHYVNAVIGILIVFLQKNVLYKKMNGLNLFESLSMISLNYLD